MMLTSISRKATYWFVVASACFMLFSMPLFTITPNGCEGVNTSWCGD